MVNSFITNNGLRERPKILMVDDKPENLIALERLLKDKSVEFT